MKVKINHHVNLLHPGRFCYMSDCGMIWRLTSLSTIFQLYRCGQFYWWEETGVHGENHRSVPEF
jgi:hypothetical protein